MNKGQKIDSRCHDCGKECSVTGLRVIHAGPGAGTIAFEGAAARSVVLCSICRKDRRIK